MSTKGSIYHSGDYVDGVPHYYLYWEYSEFPARVHLSYRDEEGRYTDMVIPEEMLEAIEHRLCRA